MITNQKHIMTYIVLLLGSYHGVTMTENNTNEHNTIETSAPQENTQTTNNDQSVSPEATWNTEAVNCIKKSGGIVIFIDQWFDDLINEEKKVTLYDLVKNLDKISAAYKKAIFVDVEALFQSNKKNIDVQNLYTFFAVLDQTIDTGILKTLKECYCQSQASKAPLARLKVISSKFDAIQKAITANLTIIARQLKLIMETCSDKAIVHEICTIKTMVENIAKKYGNSDVIVKKVKNRCKNDFNNENMYRSL